MFRLEVLYDDYSTTIKRFETKEEARWFAQNEGDHVWEYKVIEETE